MGMKTLSVNGQVDLLSLAHEAVKEPISLSEKGKTIGVIISIDAYIAYEKVMKQAEDASSKIEAFRKVVKDSKSAPNGETLDEEDYYKQYIEN